MLLHGFITDNPERRFVDSALKRLDELGFMDEQSRSLTPEGKQAARMVETGISPWDVRCMLTAATLGCLEEMSVVIAISQNLREVQSSDVALENAGGDIISVLEQYMTDPSAFPKHDLLRQAKREIQQAFVKATGQKISSVKKTRSQADYQGLVGRCLCSGYFHRLAIPILKSSRFAGFFLPDVEMVSELCKKSALRNTSDDLESDWVISLDVQIQSKPLQGSSRQSETPEFPLSLNFCHRVKPDWMRLQPSAQKFLKRCAEFTAVDCKVNWESKKIDNFGVRFWELFKQRHEPASQLFLRCFFNHKTSIFSVIAAIGKVERKDFEEELGFRKNQVLALRKEIESQRISDEDETRVRMTVSVNAQMAHNPNTVEFAVLEFWKQFNLEPLQISVRRLDGENRKSNCSNRQSDQGDHVRFQLDIQTASSCVDAASRAQNSLKQQRLVKMHSDLQMQICYITLMKEDSIDAGKYKRLLTTDMRKTFSSISYEERGKSLKLKGPKSERAMLMLQLELARCSNFSIQFPGLLSRWHEVGSKLKNLIEELKLTARCKGCFTFTPNPAKFVVDLEHSECCEPCGSCQDLAELRNKILDFANEFIETGIELPPSNPRHDFSNQCRTCRCLCTNTELALCGHRFCSNCFWSAEFKDNVCPVKDCGRPVCICDVNVGFTQNMAGFLQKIVPLVQRS